MTDEPPRVNSAGFVSKGIDQSSDNPVNHVHKLSISVSFCPLAESAIRKFGLAISGG